MSGDNGEGITVACLRMWCDFLIQVTRVMLEWVFLNKLMLDGEPMMPDTAM